MKNKQPAPRGGPGWDQARQLGRFAVFVECPQCGGRIDLRVDSVVVLYENACDGCSKVWRIFWNEQTGAFQGVAEKGIVGTVECGEVQ